MARGRVLIIESDEWAATLLAKFLGDADFSVETLFEARKGFDRIRALQPDCILCAVDLPDIDGFWVARRVRAEPPPVGATPFLFLTEAEDAQGRLQGLNVGADLFVNKPFRAEEVVAQIAALIDMARRIRAGGAQPASSPPSSRGPSVFQGDVAQMSVSTVLTVLELERRTGRLTVKADAGTATLDLVEGSFAGARLDATSYEPTALLRKVLHWKRGSFHFRTVKEKELGSERQSLSELLLDAMRLEDEGRRG